MIGTQMKLSSCCGSSRALRRAVQKHRLAADLRHDDRLAALDDAAGDAFAELIADAIAGAVEAVGGLDLQLARVFVEHDDGAADGAVMAAEDLQDAVKPGFEIERARQGLARIEQGGQAPDFASGESSGLRLRFGRCSWGVFVQTKMYG